MLLSRLLYAPNALLSGGSGTARWPCRSAIGARSKPCVNALCTRCAGTVSDVLPVMERAVFCTS